jgi:hypothetical protein
MTKAEIKAQVINLVARGVKSDIIAKELGITFNQVKAIRYGKTYQKQIAVVDTRSPQEKAWDKRRANAKAIVKANVKAKAKVKIVESNKPRIVEINGIEIEIHHSIVKRVIITQEGTIKIK